MHIMIFAGRNIMRKLSEDSGFSYANLDRMRKFHLTYEDNPRLAQLVREIPWGQNIVILEKLKNKYEREYYLRMSIKEQVFSILLGKMDNYGYYIK